MFQLDVKSRNSIYEQIIDNLKELIITGVLLPEERLPSVRELSRTLTVNPNTIQKAFRLLEEQGYIYTVAGLGTFVSAPSAKAADPALVSHIKERIRGEIKELLFLGLSLTEVRQITEDLLEERSNWK